MIDLNTSYDTPAYYNETGEVFITRDVAYGDSYSFDVWLPNGSLETLGPAVNRASTLRDDDYETVYAEYTALPSGISEDLYWLLQDVIDGRESTYEKALAIRDYLRGQDFVYTIDARYPPEGEDFVSWFVLQERRGYCTYYASAMAVMARLCGIPARYCEGYAVRANGQDSVIVTGMDAHAWAELYFRGVGWVAFDATPTDNVGDGDMDGSEREQPNSDNSQRPESNQGQEPVQTPEPSPPPSELPSSPEAVQQPTPTPEANPNSQTPQPDGEPESEPDNTQNVETDDGQTDSDDDSRQDRPSPRWPWILLLVIAAILGTGECLRRRYNANSPERISTREKDDAVRAMVWYRSVLGLLAILGFVPQGGETPAGLAARAVSSDNVPEEIITLSQAIERLQYGREKISQEAERLGGYVYTYILTHLPKRDRVKWRLHIMRRGIGDYHRIP